MARPASTLLSRRPTQLVVALLAVTFALVLVFGIVLIVHDSVTRIPRIRALVNINGEANLPAWWNGALLMTIGFGALVARAFEIERAARRAWLTVAVTGFVLSLDETVALHERMGQPVVEAGIRVPTFAWLVPGVVIGAALFVALVAVGRGLPRRTRRWLLLALICYLAGALGVEAINGTLRNADRLIYYWIGTTVEETVEMVSCVIAIGAIAGFIDDRMATATGRRTEDLEVVGHGLAGRGHGPDPDAGAIGRLAERGRPQHQARVGP